MALEVDMHVSEIKLPFWLGKKNGFVMTEESKKIFESDEEADEDSKEDESKVEVMDEEPDGDDIIDADYTVKDDESEVETTSERVEVQEVNADNSETVTTSEPPTQEIETEEDEEDDFEW